MTPADPRERLLAQDEGFRRLADEHERCEERLEELGACRWLSDDERLEQVRLKKRKLTLKDEMAKIVRRAGR